jgi:hypothetical protein
MDEIEEGSPMVNPPTPPTDPTYASYMQTLGMPGGGNASSPTVSQGGLADQQPGAGPASALQNQNYMAPYWLQSRPQSFIPGSAPSNVMSNMGGCD